jgi:hypothetical protein
MQETAQRMPLTYHPNNITNSAYAGYASRQLTTPLQHMPLHTMPQQTMMQHPMPQQTMMQHPMPQQTMMQHPMPQYPMTQHAMMDAYPDTKLNAPMSAYPAAPLVLRASLLDNDSCVSVEQMSRNLVTAQQSNQIDKDRAHERRGTKDRASAKAAATADGKGGRNAAALCANMKSIEQKVIKQQEQINRHDTSLAGVKKAMGITDAVLANHRDAIRSEKKSNTERMNKHETALMAHGDLMVPLEKSVRRMQGDMAGVVDTVSRGQTKQMSLEAQVTRIRDSFRNPVQAPVKAASVVAPALGKSVRSSPPASTKSVRSSPPASTEAAYTTFKTLQSRYRTK